MQNPARRFSSNSAAFTNPERCQVDSIVANWYTARRVAETAYGHKTLVEYETGRILGAHVVGSHADEIINIFALAIRNDLTADQIKQAIFSYPTSASDVLGTFYGDPGISAHLSKMRDAET
jgi:glutathione reductase (NADPH)